MVQPVVAVSGAARNVLEQFWAHLSAEDERDGPGVEIRRRDFRMRIAMLQQACVLGEAPRFPVKRHSDGLSSFEYRGFVFIYELLPEEIPPTARILSVTPPAGFMDSP